MKINREMFKTYFTRGPWVLKRLSDLRSVVEISFNEFTVMYINLVDLDFLTLHVKIQAYYGSVRDDFFVLAINMYLAQEQMQKGTCGINFIPSKFSPIQ